MEEERKRVVVTGASSGIGRAFAERLASMGHDLVLTGRREEILAAVADVIRRQSSVDVRLVIGDLTAPGIEAEITRVIIETRPGILINNAGSGLGASFAPWKLIYQTIIKPAGLVQPKVIVDNPEPHRFAMLVGAIFNGSATLALLSGADIIAWILVGIVVVLANLNFWLNFCLGCWMYYRFNRLGVPGFRHAPIQD